MKVIKHLQFIICQLFVCQILDLNCLYYNIKYSKYYPLLTMEHPIVQTIKSRMTAIKSFNDLNYIDLSDISCKYFPLQAKYLLEKCPNIYQINFTKCGLQSLDNLPQLNLTVLTLGYNNLKDTELTKLKIYKHNLELLNLESNQIESFQSLNFLTEFPKLAELDLKKNPLAINPEYSQIIFHSILSKNENLTIVDFYRRNGEILSDEEGKDQFLQGPQWMGEQNQEDDQDFIEDQGEQYMNENEAISLQMFRQQNLLSTNPTFFVQFTNEEQTFNDPFENCFHQDFDLGIEDDRQKEYQGQNQMQEEFPEDHLGFQAMKKRKN